MTQHTETATPRADEIVDTYIALCDRILPDGSSSEDIERDLCEPIRQLERELTTASLELSAERDAVAQYIGERNGLQRKLDAAAKFKEYVHHRLDDAGIPTHPDGAHSQHGCRVGDRMDILIGERDTLRTQLAQAQNEALELRKNQMNSKPAQVSKKPVGGS